MPRCEESRRENTWRQEAGCSNAPVQPPAVPPSFAWCPFAPFCHQFVVTFWQLWSLFCTNFLFAVLVWPSGTGGSGCIVVENGKAGVAVPGTTFSVHIKLKYPPIRSTADTEFKQTGTLTPEQRRLITSTTARCLSEPRVVNLRLELTAASTCEQLNVDCPSSSPDPGGRMPTRRGAEKLDS